MEHETLVELLLPSLQSSAAEEERGGEEKDGWQSEFWSQGEHHPFMTQMQEFFLVERFAAKYIS